MVTGSPVWMSLTRFGSRLRVQTWLVLPSAAQLNDPRESSRLFPVPGNNEDKLFQVTAVSLQLSSLNQSNSKPPAAILLKAALPGCWPAVEKFEKKLSVTEVIDQLLEP